MSLKQEFIHGVFWTAIQKYSGVVVALIVSMILARLICPSDFGIVAIATVLINFINLFTDFGIGPAIIQNDTLSKRDLDSIFSFTAYGGILGAILFFALSPLISKFYGNGQLINVCRLLSIQLLFCALNIVPNALFLKAKRFRAIALRTLILQIVTGAISVYAAFEGLGVYALLISPIVTDSMIFGYNMTQYPRRFIPNVKTESIKKIFSFSVYQFLFNVFNYFSRNLDTLLIGKYIGMKPLGFYEKSYRLMKMPLDNITNVFTPTLQPILHVLEKDKSVLFEKQNKLVSLLAAISFPLGAFLFFSADEIILLLYGSAWKGAVMTFKILALSIPLQLILSTSGAIYQSANATKYMFVNGVFNTCDTIIGFIFAIMFFGTIESVAVAWDITLGINFIVSYYILCNIVLKTHLFEFLRCIIRPFIVFIVIMAILFIGHYYMSFSNIIINLIMNSLISFSISLYVFRGMICNALKRRKQCN